MNSKKDAELTLAEIHHESLNVLKKIIEICDEININYFVAYGTLIGVVRHKGFIPWDDDVDVQMLQPEYEKFIKYCDENEKKLYPYKLVNFQNTTNYPYAIPRFCDMRYRMEKGGLHDAGMGIFVDIYPMYGVGNDVKKAQKKIVPKMKYFMSCWSFWREQRFVFSKNGVRHNILRFFVFLTSRLHDIRYYLMKLTSLSLLFSYEKSKYIECSIWSPVFKPIEKEYYKSFVLMPFESICVKVPSGYDAVLRNIYGDYMQLPPVEKRKPSHDYKIFRRS